MSGFWKVCSFLCTQYMVGPPFAWITASMRCGTEAISLWLCSGVMEAQAALITAFRSSALLGLVTLIFLLTIILTRSLPSVWIGFAWQYYQACGHPCCLCTFSYPISSFQSTLHLTCFDTALLEQPPLSVMTLCDLPSLWRVSMIVLWTIAKSAVSPIIVVSKNKRYTEFIL